MISQATKDAVLALLSVDPTITQEERFAVAQALHGDHGPDVVTVSDAMKRLGRSRQTIYNLVARGLLKGVKGAGKSGCNTGITAASIEAYLNK